MSSPEPIAQDHALPSSRNSLPRLPFGFMPRDHLVRLINEPFLAPLTLVTAPAGYGKSVAVTQWAREARMPIAWVEVSPADNAPEAFLAHIENALLTLLPDMEPGYQPASDDPAVRIVQHCDQLAGRGEPTALVLDDFDVIDNLDVLDQVTIMANNLPPNAHLIILSRAMPNIGIGRLRSLRRVKDIGHHHLAFDASQALGNIRASGRPETLFPEVEAMVRQAEGWLVGLMLTLGTSGGPPGHARDNGYPTHEHLDAYVEEEVLDFIPPDLREFVLMTCILDRLEVGLCNYVAGIGSSGKVLRDLARRGVFVEREPDGSYRYHRLFAESARRISAREWQGGDLRALYRRAGDWYIDRGQVWQAIEQYIKAEDWARCTELLKPLFHGMAGQELQHSILQWLNRLPEHVVLADHELTYHFAHAMLTIGPRQKGREFYEKWITPWHDSESPMSRARADACVALIAFSSGDHDTMLRTSHNLLKVIPLTEPAKRIGPLMGIIEVEFTRGNDDAVHEALAEANRIRLRFPDDHHEWMMQLVSAPANMHALRGDLEGAKAIYAQEVREFAGTHVDLNLRIGYRLAFIALAQNRLDEAEALLASYDEDMPVSILGRWRLNSLVCRAQALRHKGDLAGGESLLLELIERSRTEQDKVITAAARAALASIWVERGELSLVRRWLLTADESVEPWAHVFGLPNHQLVKAEALIALGQIDDAAEHLEQLVSEGTERKRWAELVQTHVYRAVVLERSSKRVEAVRAMEEAVKLGLNGEFIQPFLTSFEEVLSLLERLQPRPRTNRYVARLIDAARKRTPNATTSVLSDREREILRLAQAGSTNQEIASRLFISQATVKRHLANVNLRLGTRNRVQAIARAHELHLI